LQTYYLDFSVNCSNFITFRTSTGLRNLTCVANLDQTTELAGNNFNAFVLFTSWDILNAGTKFYISQRIVSINLTQVIFEISTQDLMQFNELKGYLVVFDESSSNIISFQVN